MKTSSSGLKSVLAQGVALGLLGTAMCLNPGHVRGQNLIINGGFEDPPGIDPYLVFAAGSPMPGWTIASGTVEIVGPYWQAAEGSQSLDLNGIFEEIGTIYQDVPVTAGQHYKIRFAYAGNVECGPAVKTTRVTWDGQELAEVSFDTTGHTRADMGWTHYEYEVVASGGTGRLGFQSLTSSFCGPAIDDVSVELIQDAPPVIHRVTASPAVLWPPNNRMVPVTISVYATDDLSAPVSRIISVTSNERSGRGNRTADFRITGPLTVELRATRLGQNTSRVYTIVVESTDSAGQTTQANVQVTVPHSRAKGAR